MSFSKTLRPTLSVFVPLALVTVLLSGCSSTTDSEQGNQKTALDRPLGKYLSALYDEKAFANVHSQQADRKRQEAIAECMKNEGFSYTPQLEPEGGNAATQQDNDSPAWGSLEFAKDYGYGIVQSPSHGEEAPSPEPEVNPNVEYLQSLSPSEQKAYEVALYGSALNEDLTTEDEVSGSTNSGGCLGKVQEKGETEPERVKSLFDDPDFKDLSDAIDAFHATPIDPDAVSALDIKWRDCLDKAGVESASDPGQLMQNLNDDFNKLLYPGGEGSDFVEPGDRARSLFQDKEIQVAVADARCQAEVKYKETRDKLEIEAEQKFVDAHKDALEAFIAKHGVRH